MIDELDDKALPIVDGLPVTTGSYIGSKKEQVSPEVSSAWMDSTYIPINTSGHPELDATTPKEAPPWYKTLAESVKRNTVLGQTWEFVSDRIEGQSPYDDPVQPNWTPLNEDAIQGLPEKLAHWVLDAESPNDQAARRKKALEQVELDEQYSRGSLFPKLIGFGAGIAEAMYLPWFLKAASMERYASIPQAIVGNIGRQIGGVAIDSVARNALEQAHIAGGNFQDAATNTFADIAFQSAFVGAIGAGITARQYAKLYNTRNTANLVADGFKVDLDVDGDVIKGVVVSSAGEAKSAAQLEAAQLYADDMFAKAGFFKDNKFRNSLKKFLSYGPFAPPALKAAASPFASVQSFFNRMGYTGLITNAESQGFVPENRWKAQEIHSVIVDEARAISDEIKDLYYKANGINGKSDTVNTVKNMAQKVTQNQDISASDFGAELSRAVTIKGYKSEWPQVHQAANIITKFYESMGEKIFDSMGKDGGFLTPRNAARYLPHNMNIDMLVEHGDKFVEITSNAMKRQYETIQRLQEPINALEREISLKRSEIEGVSDKERLKSLKKELRTLNTRRDAEQARLENQLIDDEEHHILLQDRVLFSQKDREKFNALMQPLRTEESRLVIANQNLEKLKAHKRANKNDRKIFVESKEKIAQLEKEIAEINENIEVQRDLLNQQAWEGKIDKKFFDREGNDIKFKDVNVKPKFRVIPATDTERQFEASQILDSYKSQSPEDILMGVFGSQDKGIVSDPSYLKSRSVLIDVAEYNGSTGNPVFIDTDVTKTMMNYANSMGKIIGFKKAFPEFADGIGFDGVIRQFKVEHDKAREKLYAKPDSEQRKKELRKLEKEYGQARKFLKDTHDVYMGTYDKSSPEVRAAAKVLMDLVGAAKLGKVPIYQMTELGTAVLKQGMVPVMAEGLRPKLKSLTHMQHTKEGQDMAKNAADFLIGLNGVQGGLISRVTQSRFMSYAPIGRTASRIIGGVEALSHWSGNLFFINQMANINEQIVAGAFQSEVMRACHEFKAGTISSKLKQKMVRYGIDLEKDANVFIKQYEQSGGYKTSTGGYQTKAYNWQDAKAAEIMRMSVRRAVKDTIVNKNMFTSPYWSNNSIGKTIFMFHGWAYDTFVHYTLPMMQRPQGEHALNVAVIVGLNMMIAPLARIANGKDAYEDDTNWLNEVYQALDYSGLVGPYSQMLETLNTITGDRIPGITTERGKDRSLLGALGPVFGYANDAYSVVNAAASGNMTEGNFKRLIRLAPFSSSPLLSIPAAAWIKSLGLPSSSNSATPWAINRSLRGDM